MKLYMHDRVYYRGGSRILKGLVENRLKGMHMTRLH